MLFFRSYFFKGSETDLNKLVQKQLALNSTITTLESSQANGTLLNIDSFCVMFLNRENSLCFKFVFFGDIYSLIW